MNLYSLRILALLFISAAAALAQTSTADPFAPTHGVKSADEIDKEWQKSVTKFDGVRASILREVERQTNDGPYRADWETLEKYETPQWFADAKFGIFIHWGGLSVSGIIHEWYPRNLYLQGDQCYEAHLKKYGPQDKVGYKELLAQFKAEKWDPADWARLFKQAGARYVVPVAEHHEGFSMYDSVLSEWTATKMGPKRDIVADLGRAVRAQGMHFGVSSHRAEHTFYFAPGRDIRSDVNDPNYASLYGPAHPWMRDPKTMSNDWTYVSREFADDWLARTAELVAKYKPDLVYFDGGIGQPNFRPNVTRFVSYYYNYGAQHDIPAVITMKDYSMNWKSAVRDFEPSMSEQIEPSPWQTDTSISNLSWGYLEKDEFKSSDFIVHQLIDIVSKNGNLLLNIGPRPDGTISDEVRQELLEVGAWLGQNGDAIYGTRPWKIYGEGPTRVQAGYGKDKDTKPSTPQDFRFTKKGNNLYAIQMAWPTDGRAVIHALGSTQEAKGLKITDVKLLGSQAKLQWHQYEYALEVRLPDEAPGKYAYALQVATSN